MNHIPGILVVFAVLAVCAGLAGCAANQSATPPSTTPSPSPAATGGGPTVTLNLVASNMAFDQATITVPAGAHVVMAFDNRDAGVIHNFALYKDSSAATRFYAGDFVTGPGKVTYTFDAPSTPGTYFFRCDVHPTVMTGAFIVT